MAVQALRYFHTIRHLRPRQWLWRPYLRIQRQIYLRCSPLRRMFHARASAIANRVAHRQPGPFLPTVEWEQVDPQPHLRVADDAVALEFTFLNQTIQFPGKIDWACKEASQLWIYNLQYSAYLTSLGIAYRTTGRPQYFEAFKKIVSGWIEANPFPSGDGWHAYVVSLRAVNWMFSLHLFSDRLDGETDFRQNVLTSLVKQLEYIYYNLELDVGGNHLLENIKALCVAGAFFSGGHSEKWLYRGLALLQAELKRQVLPDGGHFERSPMYHAIVLEDLLLIAAALRNAQLEPPETLHTDLQRMIHFYTQMLHPDGEIALFNDAAFHIAPDPGSLLRLAGAVLNDLSLPAGKLDAAYAMLAKSSPNPGSGQSNTERTIAEFPHSGYYVVRREDTALFFDAGPVCPDDLPAHAHADIFSYELSVGGTRWIVDSGVREYAAGPWRRYSRGTSAHNTVALDGQNQVDVWSSFRVGYRVKPTLVRCHQLEGATVLAGRHAGYGHNRAHSRLIVDIDSHTWLIIDEVAGSGDILVESFIHLHPDVSLSSDENSATLTAGAGVLRCLVAGAAATASLRGQTE
ncbi:MAG: heparinase II/III family protein, partial [Armatimonadota bacterium]|nr:heparinase II/III family protein [Armatimonadota bacterium]